MAADGRVQAPSLIEELFAHGPRFDFFQAVALLEASKAGSASVGTTGEPSLEALDFAGNVRLASPTAPIDAVERKGRSGKARMTVNFLGVAGALGPLPLPFAELVLRRSVAGDHAARELLDIFNHRLLSIAYRIRKRHLVGLGVRTPKDDDAYRYLAAVAGIGTPHLTNRLTTIDDGAIVSHAHLFARDARSMAGLEALLQSHFDIPVEGIPLTGQSFPIEPVDRTRIGPSGQNRRLGKDAILGARTWDQQAAFDVRVGPLSVDDYLRFLPPHGDRLAPFCELVRLYAGPSPHFRVRVLLDPARAKARSKAPSLPSQTPLTLRDRPRLGSTAWIGKPWGRREIVLTEREVALR